MERGGHLVVLRIWYSSSSYKHQEGLEPCNSHEARLSGRPYLFSHQLPSLSCLVRHLGGSAIFIKLNAQPRVVILIRFLHQARQSRGPPPLPLQGCSSHPCSHPVSHVAFSRAPPSACISGQENTIISATVQPDLLGTIIHSPAFWSVRAHFGFLDIRSFRCTATRLHCRALRPGIDHGSFHTPLSEHTSIRVEHGPALSTGRIQLGVTKPQGLTANSTIMAGIEQLEVHSRVRCLPPCSMMRPGLLTDAS